MFHFPGFGKQHPLALIRSLAFTKPPLSAKMGSWVVWVLALGVASYRVESGSVGGGSWDSQTLLMSLILCKALIQIEREMCLCEGRGTREVSAD